MTVTRFAVRSILYFVAIVAACWGARFIVTHTAHTVIPSSVAYLYCVACLCFIVEMVRSWLAAIIKFTEA